MGKKAISFQQRLVAFGVTANVDELNAALDTLLAFKASKFPKVARAVNKGGKRKPQSQLNPPPASPVNGEDGEAHA